MKWISVKERLPEKENWYLVSVSSELWGINGVPKRYVMECQYFEGLGFENSNVVAWMNHPEPYVEI